MTYISRRAQQGAFHWFESLIVLAIAVIAVLIWWPLSKASKLAQGERAAMGTMRQFVLHWGEAKDLRTLVAALPAAYSTGPAFNFHTENIAEREGYFYRYTPKLDSFVLYAWPAAYGETGNAAFLFDPPRPLLETRNHRRHYSGLRRPPQDKAGLPAGKDENTAAFGKDAQEWKVAVDNGS